MFLNWTFKTLIPQLGFGMKRLKYKSAFTRRVWRYQRGNQNPYIEEEQTIQWSKEKIQKDKQRSTKHAHKTKDRVTRAPVKTGGQLRCSGMVSSSCPTNGKVGEHIDDKSGQKRPYADTCIICIADIDN